MGFGSVPTAAPGESTEEVGGGKGEAAKGEGEGEGEEEEEEGDFWKKFFISFPSNHSDLPPSETKSGSLPEFIPGLNGGPHHKSDSPAQVNTGMESIPGECNSIPVK